MIFRARRARRTPSAIYGISFYSNKLNGAIRAFFDILQSRFVKSGVFPTLFHNYV